MIDPRLEKKEAEEAKKDIINATSFMSPIKRSLLSAAPEKMIIPFGIEAKNLTMHSTPTSEHARFFEPDSTNYNAQN